MDPERVGERYRHIDALFGEPGRNVIDWDLIENHYLDMMRVVLSIQEGKISSATLLRRLWTYSRHNNFYQAFREVGRVIGTVQLLRFLSDPQLRRRTTAETNKVESCNRFSDWCRFGNHGVITANDRDEQEKILKFSTLLTNAVIFHTTLDMMTAEGVLDHEGVDQAEAALQDVQAQHPEFLLLVPVGGELAALAEADVVVDAVVVLHHVQPGLGSALQVAVAGSNGCGCARRYRSPRGW